MNRQIDNFGRIVIPKEILKSLNINPKDKLNITVEGNKIVLEKTDNLDTIYKYLKENNLYDSFLNLLEEKLNG